MFTRSPHKSEANYFGEAVNHLLNKAKQRIIKDAGIHDENAATVQSREKHCFSSLAKTVLLLCYFSHYFHIYFTIISSPICYTQYILFQGAICRYMNPYLYRDFYFWAFYL